MISLGRHFGPGKKYLDPPPRTPQFAADSFPAPRPLGPSPPPGFSIKNRHRPLPPLPAPRTSPSPSPNRKKKDPKRPPSSTPRQLLRSLGPLPETSARTPPRTSEKSRQELFQSGGWLEKCLKGLDRNLIKISYVLYATGRKVQNLAARVSELSGLSKPENS